MNRMTQNDLLRIQFLPRLWFICMLAALVAGCATPAAHEGMIPVTFEIATKHPRTVSVSVSGGKETATMGTPQISDAEFAKALVDSIIKSQTFSQVIEGKGADYLLTVMLFGMEQPFIGGSFTVKLEAGWTLKRADTSAIVWQEAIKSEHTASFGDAFVAATRLRLATEGAARNNILQGLARISKLNL